MYFLSQTYRQKALSDTIASIYAKFEVPYYPNNNDDYGYNWNDGLRRLVATSDSYGELAYSYHSDHLGSTSFVTDANGEVSQHVEYVPFGEVFIEELSSSAKLNTPFLFNGKELDEETGLYYYGARYYDPRTSLWLSTDPMELKYPNISSYAYCLNNPVNAIDPNGAEIAFFENAEYRGIIPEYLYSSVVRDDNLNKFIEEYSISEYYNKNNDIVGYGAQRNGRLEYIMTLSSDIVQFIKNIKLYRAAASLYYQNGMPSRGWVALVSGDVLRGLSQLWADALTDPEYYVYVMTMVVGAGNYNPSKNINFSNRSLQHMYSRHGADFGMKANWNNTTATAFKEVLRKHIDKAIPIKGTY